ncbi:unnamed protein product [Rotaria magnacalcarata]|uniref:Peptidase S9 prolyl oligopeptidase catalytic domain-containing protein n=1 Tax=Rotaria magnacalcarata TaxID=392030 RepID=A0A818YGW9_9BILA|nr:unnamed protein product [Rotaria magnacalcarata]CAF3753437.1 unnamed protein product [Rotaria magnacalcarata]
MSSSLETFSFIGANNETVWGWHIPPIKRINQKAPLTFLIHGDPQASCYNSWSYRWNFHVKVMLLLELIFVVLIHMDKNFTNKLGLNAALNLFNYIDGNRAIALGASYGGYMIDWIAGHTQMNQRFQAFVNYHGIFDVRQMVYSTDELWFIEYDIGQFTQYENPQAYEIFNPINYISD